MAGISAIMKNDYKVFILNTFHNSLDVFRRKLLAVVVRHQSRSRLGHHDTIGTRLAERQTVLLDELRTLLQQRMSCVGMLVNQHHNLRHIIEASSQ